MSAIAVQNPVETAIKLASDREIEPANDFERIIWEKRKQRGRPTTFTLEIAAEILGRVQAGETLYRLCKDDSAMPEYGTVLDWAERWEDFGHALQRIRTRTAGLWAQRAMEDVQTAHDRDTAAAAKVKLDAAKWYAGILNPKEYGQQQAQQPGNKFIFNVDRFIAAAPVQDTAATMPMIDAPALPASER